MILLVLYTVYCILYIVYCILYTVYCILLVSNDLVCILDKTEKVCNKDDKK